MPPLKPETRWSATLVQTCSVIGCLFFSAWYIRGEVEAIRQSQARVETFIREQAVTQEQAERYAAAFRWENRNLEIIVPSVREYRN